MRIGQALAAAIFLFLPISISHLIPNQTELWSSLEQRSLEMRGLAGDVELRIMPLGASIVWGANSTDGNGFRYGLRNKLELGGNSVNMVGSVRHGNMKDNDVEGWPGFLIDQVGVKAKLTYPSKPNIVLLHVGTNDMKQNKSVSTAHLRLGKLIDEIFDSVPGVTIIASTLLPNWNATTMSRIAIYNKNIVVMVEQKRRDGKHVTCVDFSSSQFSNSDLIDGTHPTDAGYLKMATVWYQGIEVAANASWITAPVAVSGIRKDSGTDGTPRAHFGIVVGAIMFMLCNFQLSS